MTRAFDEGDYVEVDRDFLSRTIISAMILEGLTEDEMVVLSKGLSPTLGGIMSDVVVEPVVEQPLRCGCILHSREESDNVRGCPILHINDLIKERDDALLLVALAQEALKRAVDLYGIDDNEEQ